MNQQDKADSSTSLTSNTSCGACDSIGEVVGDVLGSVIDFGVHELAQVAGPYAPVAEYIVDKQGEKLTDMLGDAIGETVGVACHYVHDLFGTVDPSENYNSDAIEITQTTTSSWNPEPNHTQIPSPWNVNNIFTSIGNEGVLLDSSSEDSNNPHGLAAKTWVER